MKRTISFMISIPFLRRITIDTIWHNQGIDRLYISIGIYSFIYLSFITYKELNGKDTSHDTSQENNPVSIQQQKASSETDWHDQK